MIDEIPTLNLSAVAKLSKKKIDSVSLNENQYVSTENMLPEKGGVFFPGSKPKGKITEFEVDDILVSNIRPYFKKIWNASIRGGCSNDVLVFKANDNIEPKFLYYSLANNLFFDYVMQGSKGTKMPRGDKAHIMEYQIKLHNKSTQFDISRTLSAFDDKIEVNNKINSNLEELAQTLYKRWFVDFEFPNEEGKSYRSSGGEMVESEIGLIPKGWEVLNLGDALTIKYGKNLPTKNLLPDGYAVYGGNGIIGYTDNYLFEEPKVIVSCRGAASGKSLYTSQNVFITNNSLILVDNEKIIFEYLKEFSLYRNYYDFATGSAQPQITIESLKYCPITIPDLRTQINFKNTVKPMNEISEINKEENHNLSEIRDLLLPKLMSGEIEV